MVSRSVADVSLTRSFEGMWRGRKYVWTVSVRDTYRAHDGGLPVELSRSSVRAFCRIASSPRPKQRCRLSRKKQGRVSDVPDHLRWGQPSRKREGHYACRVSENCEKGGCLRGCSGLSRLQHPAFAGCHASKRAGRTAREEGATYRPRSVSSLLIRLRAMATSVVVGGFWCRERVPGRGESVVLKS